MGSVATWDDEILDQRCTVPIVARWNRATVISCDGEEWDEAQTADIESCCCCC